ncbi:hypothetical protein CA13_09780 [Planctomycetes bacterium CA13]|uniref:Uncharacterized protein n=1 Tax=Novipirellula herctigrandis TaxID=2527986 RepID=A0A5C5YX17_9BACT|nr:hypothetical protein CA13_09780 [Planctomycetes bacterium CA13]
MLESKTECTKCRALILQVTADRNGGRCKPCATGAKLENISEGMEFGMRFLLGAFFGAMLAGVGFALGSFLGTVGGVVVAIPFALTGFIYGCFCVEINAIIRSLLPFMLDP